MTWLAGIDPHWLIQVARAPILYDEFNLVDSETQQSALRDVIVFGRQVAACGVVGDCDRDWGPTPLDLTSWGEPIQKCSLRNLGPNFCLGCRPIAVWILFALLVGQLGHCHLRDRTNVQPLRRELDLERQVGPIPSLSSALG